LEDEINYFQKLQQGVFLALVLFLFCPNVATAKPTFAGEANVYGVVEWFEWKEFNDNGSRLLRESGPRYGIGFTYNFEFFDQHLILKPRIEVIGGQVDYDGATQAGVPVKTDTDYFGGKLELDLGWRFGSLKRASIEPYVGVAIRGWSRDINDATASNGTQAIGYTEEWYTAYARAGLRGDLALGEKSRLFMEAGGKFPFYNENTAKLSYSGLGSDVTLKPGNSPSWYAEAGFKYRVFKMSFYYDTMRFSKSAIVWSGIYGYYQPKSDADMCGIRLGAAF
jgi:hypothetical protein